MVARTEQGGDSIDRPTPVTIARAWFYTWRVLVTRAIAGLRGLLDRIRFHPRPSLIIALIRSPEQTVATAGEERTRLAAFGIRAFVAGAAGIVVVSAMTGGVAAVALSRVVSAIAWALARLAVLWVFAEKDPSTRRRVLIAWAIGLAPFLLGVTTGLRAAAFFASAVYTLAALSGTGVEPSHSRSLVIRAFGAQALVMGTAWGLRALLAAFIALGSSL